jgi:predicted ferric reductase
MLAKKYRSELISVLNPFEGIYTLEFKSLGRAYKYKPGQYLHIAMDEEYDGIGQWPDSRCFSMQSNPSEDNIRITYAVKGAFTKNMKESLKIGSEVWLKLAYGDLFTQIHNKTNTVFIAGGTGITPFLSLFTHESFSEYLSPKIYLGFRSLSYNNYNDELDRSCNSAKNLKIFSEDQDGLIDIENIFNENGRDSSYFISGPPIMIKIFKQALISNKVPEENVLTDDWE